MERKVEIEIEEGGDRDLEEGGEEKEEEVEEGENGEEIGEDEEEGSEEESKEDEDEDRESFQLRWDEKMRPLVSTFDEALLAYEEALSKMATMDSAYDKALSRFERSEKRKEKGKAKAE